MSKTHGGLTPAVGPNDHAQGRADAPVTLVEYGDYECPYCGMAYPVVKQVQRRLGDKLRFVFRNFPLAEAHPHATDAAEAAEAAARRASSGKCTTCCTSINARSPRRTSNDMRNNSPWISPRWRARGVAARRASECAPTSSAACAAA